MMRLLFGVLLLGLAGDVRAVGRGNDLIPDLPTATDEIRLAVVADISPSVVIDITHAGDGSGRLFIVSPDGVIRILKNGVVLATPFLNAPATPDDRAMSGLAFHPNFASNGKFYVISGEATPNASVPDYTSPQDDTSSAFDNVLLEYQVDPNQPDLVDPNSKRELLRVHQPHRLHNMDDLAFGNDGYLYISMGDNGKTREGTPTEYQTTAQRTDLPYGSVLRIDVDSNEPGRAFAIPDDNPFAGDPNHAEEIFAWGMRNPWRISVDRLTGDVYTGVNGDFTIEQIVRVELGKNYGWAEKEGSFLWDPSTGDASVDPAPNPAFTAPLAEYDHNWTTKGYGSVIGGYVYRGLQMPEFRGIYLCFDHIGAEMIAMVPETGALSLVPLDPNGEQLMSNVDITWGEDEVGELYIGRGTGQVLKLESDGVPVPIFPMILE